MFHSSSFSRASILDRQRREIESQYFHSQTITTRREKLTLVGGFPGMANYGYGYGNYTSQPQQFNPATYGYTSQPATRVVQGYQAAGAAAAYGATTGYAQQAPVQAVPVSSGGGYGYFQRASDPTQQQQQQQGGAAGYNQKSNYNTSQQQQPPQQQQQGQGTDFDLMRTIYSLTSFDFESY